MQLMEQDIHDFFHGLVQELLAKAEVSGNFLLATFMETFAGELLEAGFVDGFEFCHWRADRGMRVDGYWFDDEGGLDLFIADFEQRQEMKSLTWTEADAALKRLARFLDAAMNGDLAARLEMTSPEHDLAGQIADRRTAIDRVNLILFSERMLSERVQAIPEMRMGEVTVTRSIWDVARLHRHRSSRGHREPIDIDLIQMFGRGIPCLPVHPAADADQTFLMVMPGELLASLYERFGARLLEQNVRTFLQARGQVNRGIRETILREPGMFIAYNNGITATARRVGVVDSAAGPEITRMSDLQIVNGGQTTASLFHVRKRDRADLLRVFVQMKLTVIDDDQGEVVVSKISRYANTQNRVSAADFFSNHPFHVRMEEFSRRIWAPARRGAQRETHWFYERARGQYADVQTMLTVAEKRRFLAEYPRAQVFTKTDLARFENVWDDHPRFVNLGAQKNFVRFAQRIAQEWGKSQDAFDEAWFRRAVARALIFRAAEHLVTGQPWYNGGYRANVVAYTLAILAEIIRRRRRTMDWQSIWNGQDIGDGLVQAIALVAREVHEDITQPPSGISNISEWCKKEACWTRLQDRIGQIETLLPPGFDDWLVSSEEHHSTLRNPG
jgi:hypothetical protein